MTCQEAIDVMDDAIEGRLPSTLRAGFGEHMAECAPCATYLEHLRLTRQALRLQRAGEESANPRRDELIEKYKRELGRDPH